MIKWLEADPVQAALVSICCWDLCKHHVEKTYLIPLTGEDLFNLKSVKQTSGPAKPIYA